MYLGQRAFLVGRGGLCTQQRLTPDLETSLKAFSEWAQGLGSKVAVRVWLGLGVCRPFVMKAVPGIHDNEEWAKAATAIAAERTGLTESCVVQLDIAADRDEAFVVVVPQSLTELLLNMAQGRTAKIALRGIKPWWGQVLNEALRDDRAIPAICIHDSDGLLLLSGQGASFETAACVVPVTSVAAAEAALARTAFAAGLDTDRVMRVHLGLDDDEEVNRQGQVQAHGQGWSALAFGGLVRVQR